MREIGIPDGFQCLIMKAILPINFDGKYKELINITKGKEPPHYY